ncbi:hypothetical protein Acr_20g0002000 [Actinidia rufa]|uniref:Uncharacterized protein n=1 Tax=Actinidia rufa TaxID=165716 RepID=A0A7J0GCB3_9ERIC|nr:hypothetical protein Acr_20g0002000 [Actinidia rufa]
MLGNGGVGGGFTVDEGDGVRGANGAVGREAEGVLDVGDNDLGAVLDKELRSGRAYPNLGAVLDKELCSGRAYPSRAADDSWLHLVCQPSKPMVFKFYVFLIFSIFL